MLEINLHQRFLKFIQNIYKQGSQLLKTVTGLAQKNPFSVFGNNSCIMRFEYGTDYIDCTKEYMSKQWKSSIPSNTKHVINVLHEIINIRDGILQIDHFSMDDIMAIIENICIY